MKSSNIIYSIVFCLGCCYCFFLSEAAAQNTWTQKSSVPGGCRTYPVSFTIGSKGYIGTGGCGNSGASKDFWEYDPASNSWTQKANFGGAARHAALGFSVGGKGYIGLGTDGATTYHNDFWEYDPGLNSWILKNIFPGSLRYAGVAFSIGTKGYIGTGMGQGGVYLQDFWEWSQATNTWTQRAPFGGTARFLAAGFSIGSKGYIGTGSDASSNPTDFWEYSQATDSWSQKANFIGTARGGAAGFSIGNKGYLGTGIDASSNKYQDFYEYNPVTDTWLQRASFLGAKRLYATGFSIGNKGYLGTGFDAANDDFWEYTPVALTLSITATNSSCGQATGTASVVVTGGDPPYSYQWTNGDKTSLADSLSAGLIMVYVVDASGFTAQAPVMINDAGAPTVSVTATANISCNGGNNGSINISVTGGTSPYTYLWGNGNTSQNMSNLQAGPHQVQVSDASGCIANKIVILTEPAKITLNDTIQDATCGNNNGVAGVIVSGGTSPYAYSWSTGATTQYVSNLSAGSYSVLVTDNKGCTKSGMGSIVNAGAAVAVIDSIHPAVCSTGLGSVFISVTGGTPPYTYAWTNGATTQDLVGVPKGNYGVTIYSNGNPCTGAFSGTLPAKMPYTPSICIVTVDTATGKNQCAFVKDSLANLGLKQYNFYRETTTAGVYQKLGSKPANQISLWTDQSANPLQRAWRYKITSEDSCGNEAVISGLHKTIHLAANIGVTGAINLSWDDYEGFSYGSFFIWRYSPASGWIPMDTLPSNLHSWSDWSPPTPLVDVNYFVEVVPPAVCVATGINPDPEATNLNTSRSNVFRINPSTSTSVQEEVLVLNVQVYPNPSNGIVTVAGLARKAVVIGFYNLMGEQVKQSKNINGTEQVICDLQALPPGIYFMKVRTDKEVVTRKVVLNR